ncbi:MAG TPA: hypothetical protein VMF12_07820 [Xanthobacteraceae bacterium]|nr:hypothetical protein [Xanthobacteraceae bacterium]
MQALEYEFDSKLRQLHFFNLDEWGGVYRTSPEEEFADYQVSNPGIFRIDRLPGWPRVKQAALLRAFRFGTRENQRTARIIASELWIFPFDIAAVSLVVQHRGSMTSLRNLSLEIKASGELREYAEQLACSQFADYGCQLLGREDHQYIQIHQPLKESILEERYQDITAILTGDDEQFSDQYIEEILENAVPYTRHAYAYIGSRCVIQVHPKIDDLFCLWLLQSAYAKKSQRVEAFLDARLQGTYQLLSRPRSFLPLAPFSHSALQRAKPFDGKTLQIVEQFLTPFEIIGTGFFSLANETITDVLDIDAWQTTIKEKYGDLEDSYEHLENSYSMKNQELVEWLIIIVIILSALLTVTVEVDPHIWTAVSGFWKSTVSGWWHAGPAPTHD